MITIIVPYRNRSLSRVKKSLDSLSMQTNQNFEVQFIDYGSNLEISNKAKELVSNYSFAMYTISHHQNTMWNKSRAINIVLKDLITDYCFVADIDMIFHPEFVNVLHQVKQQDKVVYFQVGFLSQEESKKNIPFEEYKIKFTSTDGATGLSLFPVNELKKVNGFDEFYHLWGAEDTDVHNRLKLQGLKIIFYDSQILMLHQYHKIYRHLKDNKVTKHITIKEISRINLKYCKDQYTNENIIANSEKPWGNIQSEQEYQKLLNPTESESISLNKNNFNKWMESLRNKSINTVVLYHLEGSNSWAGNIISKLYGKYTLKEASDLLLLNHIEHLRNKKYLYQVSKDCKKIDYTLCRK